MSTLHKGRATVVGVVAAAALAAGYATAAAGTQEAAKEEPAAHDARSRQHRSTAADDDYQATLRLSDGRQVTVRLVEGTGVQERHRDSGSASWSKWQTLYKTDTDRCQGVKLEEVNGTVSLIADFGRYCYDGEPPTESLAGVGTGDLTDWDVDVTEDFDGWQDTSINDDGSRVVFLYDSDEGLYYQRWQRSSGFEEPHV